MGNEKNMPITPLYVLLIMIVAVLAFNQYQLSSINNQEAVSVTGAVIAQAPVSQPQQAQPVPQVNLQAIADKVIPKGIPEIYGKELAVSFDDVSANTQQKADETIGKIGALDDKIQLSGDLLQRYIKIAGSISCEYCCGAESIIFPDGSAACGCAHSYAMRGLAKYLLKNHANEYADDKILEELGKWKTLFFPGIMLQKAKVLQDKGIELNYINLASNKYRGIEKGAGSSGGGMVGGC